MLVSSKWQTMWMESQNCSNNVVNISLPSQQAEKILEDVRLNCTSPNKGVQLEALKCWGSWINNRNSEEWKLNSVCYTAIRPLLMKKLQPLHKDVDVCKLKLSLMWKLLGKVQHMMHLEGPQYILEVFLQSCLMWLSSTDGVDNEISVLIFQLFLSLFKKSDELIKCDKEMFPPLTEDILESKKAFQRHVDKFLNVVVRWRKLKDKTLLLVVWKCFLEHCERFCDNIPVRIWHEVFKTVGQICSETTYSLKERLAFLHGCATTLDSVLSSSKFIDFGNLLTTPCEALLKKLLDLSVGIAGEEDDSFQLEGEVFDADMFVMSRDVCQVLSVKSVLVVSGYDLCNYVLDGLEDSSLKSMFWGIWCGLVHCYKTQLSHVDRSKFTKTEMKFYRRLRGVAVNFDLDRQDIEKDCAAEVERHIQVLNIGCFCNSLKPEDEKPEQQLEAMDVVDEFSSSVTDLVEVNPRRCDPLEEVPGRFSTVAIYKPKTVPSSPKFLTLNFEVVKDVLNRITVSHGKSLLEGLFGIRFLSLKKAEGHEMVVRTPAIGFRKMVMARDCKKSSPKLWYSVTASPKAKPREKAKEKVVKKKKEGREETKLKTEREEGKEEDVNSTPKTRSKRKAEVEEEKKRKESMGCQTRRRRRSFEVLVQEIVKKNKLRKSEKSVRRKSPVMVGKREKVTRGKKEMKEADKKMRREKKVVKVPKDVKGTKMERQKTEKGKTKEIRKDGKLENYFKVLRKTKTRSERKKEEEEQAGKSKKKTRRRSGKEESDKKVETGWKQTSLKSIMTPKKDEKGKQGKQSKDKTPEKEREDGRKKRGKKEAKKPEEQDLKNISPFKEVLHDHEYAKTTEPEYLPGSKRIVMRRYKNPEEVVHDIEKKFESVEGESPVQETSPQEESPTLVVEAEPSIESPVVTETPTEPESIQKTEETDTMEVTKDEVKPLQEVEEPSNDNRNRKRKRILMMDSVKPNCKRQKKEEETKEEEKEEEETAIEVIEKENMEVINLENKPEVNVTPTKEGILSEKTINTNSRTVGSDMSPITSRALRMIALLPDTTKGGQVHRDSTSPKTETKSVKGTNVNVDKSSRASKMLALISENVVRGGDEPMDWNEDVVSEVPTKPSVTTPVSIVSSPKGIKKRKSIRFDEAKNETFMYQIGTPPSQIWRKCDPSPPF